MVIILKNKQQFIKAINYINYLRFKEIIIKIINVFHHGFFQKPKLHIYSL